jgi:hypothetical protein
MDCYFSVNEHYENCYRNNIRHRRRPTKCCNTSIRAFFSENDAHLSDILTTCYPGQPECFSYILPYRSTRQ